MQESLRRKDVSLDEMMAEVVELRGRCAQRACGDRGDGAISSALPVRGSVLVLAWVVPPAPRFDLEVQDVLE